MPNYHYRLVASRGGAVDLTERELPSDEDAIKEAGAAAGEVLLSDLAEGGQDTRATVTVSRDEAKLAEVSARATVKRFTD